MIYRRGCGFFTPYKKVLDIATLELADATPIADAVSPEALPGEKAGNYLIDTNFRESRYRNFMRGEMLKPPMSPKKIKKNLKREA